MAKQQEEGLDGEAALRRWSLPAEYTAMQEYADAANSVTNEPESRRRNREYNRRRDALENAFVAKLKRGEIFCSGIEKHADDRSIIKPALWSIFMVEYDFDHVGYQGHVYEAAEFFEPQEIPLNISEIPDWLRRYINGPVPVEFEHDDSYQHVTIRGINFVLGDIQSNVIYLLHKASLTTNPWRRGKLLLDEADSEQIKLGELFKKQENWRELIKSDGRGGYRLNLRSGHD